MNQDLIATSNGKSSLSTFTKNEIQLVTDYSDFAEISLSDEKKAKEILASTRKKLALQLDSRKMKQADMVMSSIEQNIEIMNDEEVMKRVKANMSSSLDLKMLAEANEKNFKMLQNLIRLDSIDGAGTAGRLNVAVSYNNGTESVAVLVET